MVKKSISEELIQNRSANDGSVALWKISSESSHINKNVFLTHGTFSDKKVLTPISIFMAERGFTCWIMEWRGHGASSIVNDKFNFETIALEDIKSTLEYLRSQNIGNIHCITHSGGGICLTIALSVYPQLKDNIQSISMFGCQAFGAGHTLYKMSLLVIMNQIFRLIGTMPARLIGSPHNESYYMMKQWFQWNIRKEFRGKNNVDYRQLMPRVQIPVLSICGAGDKFTAPITGCQSFLNSFKNERNKLLLCSLNNGYREDYDHTRVLHSRNASEEIYPVVNQWIQDNS